MDVWPTFQTWFREDDGSLPGIGAEGFTGEEVAQLYLFLRSLDCQTQRSVQQATFWNTKSQSNESVDSVPNAAALVITGEAEPFHFLLSSPRFAGVLLPNIGVHIFRDSIMLDYRMGAEWSSDSVRAFLHILWLLLSAGTNARLVFDSSFGGEREFLDAWNRLSPITFSR